jgi:hypothetical protein
MYITTLKTTIMKTLTIFTALIISVSICTGQKDSLNSEIQRDIQIELSARVIEGQVYFKLLMLNESQPGFYSVVKEYADGTFESVEMREIAVNTINQPLMYCFVDKPKSLPAQYKLLRISNEVEYIKTWLWSELGNGICVDKRFVAAD